MLQSVHRQGYQAAEYSASVYPDTREAEKRPLGLPCVADRALQRSAAQVLSAIYEQDFLSGSFGGRPGRGSPSSAGRPHMIYRQLLCPARLSITTCDRHFGSFRVVLHLTRRAGLRQDHEQGGTARLRLEAKCPRLNSWRGKGKGRHYIDGCESSIHATSSRSLCGHSCDGDPCLMSVNLEAGGTAELRSRARRKVQGWRSSVTGSSSS